MKVYSTDKAFGDQAMSHISDENEKWYKRMERDFAVSAKNYMHYTWSTNVTSRSLPQRNTDKSTKEDVHGNLVLHAGL